MQGFVRMQMERFISPVPVVRLENAFTDPFKNLVATAQTCYSGKGIVTTDKITEGYEKLARSIYKAGHHTTLQHAHFQFTLNNVSRQFVWSFLHSHPFYNSARKMDKEVMKKAQEVARYVIPVSAFTYLYHTVNALTLFRYYRLCNQYDAPLEQRIVVDKMIQEVLRAEPLYKTILEEPLDMEAMPEYQFFASHPQVLGPRIQKRFLKEFDASLGGRLSRLVDYKQNNEATVAQSVREVLGLPSSRYRDKRRLSDYQALRLVLDPSQNSLYGETLNVATLSKQVLMPDSH